MGWWVPLLLALAVSIDGFSAGFSCGMRKLTIPFTSLLVLCLLSAGAITVSMLAGSGVAHLLPLRYISTFGGAVFITFGLYLIRQQYGASRPKEEPAVKSEEVIIKTNYSFYSSKIAFLLQRPEKADLDHSGTLSAREALLLGSALAADAFTAGFGAALIGLPLLPTVFAVGLTKLVLVPLGATLGRAALRAAARPHTSLWGGAILIFIGIMNLF